MPPELPPPSLLVEGAYGQVRVTCAVCGHTRLYRDPLAARLADSADPLATRVAERHATTCPGTRAERHGPSLA